MCIAEKLEVLRHYIEVRPGADGQYLPVPIGVNRTQRCSCPASEKLLRLDSWGANARLVLVMHLAFSSVRRQEKPSIPQ